jgi:hypothetical protein
MAIRVTISLTLTRPRKWHIAFLLGRDRTPFARLLCKCSHASPDIPVVLMDYNVNDPEFSREATDMLLRMIEKERHHGDRA